MRVLLSLLLVSTAFPALADTITAESRITEVTVYPDGARLTREITFAAPSAGTHELLVTDLPWDSDPAAMQLVPGAGLQLGAFSLRSDRLPPREDPLTPEQEAAKAKVKELEAAAEGALLAVDAVNARIDAAEARAQFLSSFTGSLPEGATPETIRDMAAMIGAETLAARQEALAARADLWPTQVALTEAQEALADAEPAADPHAEDDRAALAPSLRGQILPDLVARGLLPWARSTVS